MARGLGPTRRIRKAALARIVGKNHRAVARKMVEQDGNPLDPAEFKKQIAKERRWLLRAIQTEGENIVESMTPGRAEAVAEATGSRPDDFLEPAVSPVDRRIAKLESELKTLRAQRAERKDP